MNFTDFLHELKENIFNPDFAEWDDDYMTISYFKDMVLDLEEKINYTTNDKEKKFLIKQFNDEIFHYFPMMNKKEFKVLSRLFPLYYYALKNYGLKKEANKIKFALLHKTLLSEEMEVYANKFNLPGETYAEFLDNVPRPVQPILTEEIKYWREYANIEKEEEKIYELKERIQNKKEEIENIKLDFMDKYGDNLEEGKNSTEYKKYQILKKELKELQEEYENAKITKEKIEKSFIEGYYKIEEQYFKFFFGEAEFNKIKKIDTYEEIKKSIEAIEKDLWMEKKQPFNYITAYDESYWYEKIYTNPEKVSNLIYFAKNAIYDKNKTLIENKNLENYLIKLFSENKILFLAKKPDYEIEEEIKIAKPVRFDSVSLEKFIKNMKSLDSEGNKKIFSVFVETLKDFVSNYKNIDYFLKNLNDLDEFLSILTKYGLIDEVIRNNKDFMNEIIEQYYDGDEEEDKDRPILFLHKETEDIDKILKEIYRIQSFDENGIPLNYFEDWLEKVIDIARIIEKNFEELKNKDEQQNKEIISKINKYYNFLKKRLEALKKAKIKYEHEEIDFNKMEQILNDFIYGYEKQGLDRIKTRLVGLRQKILKKLKLTEENSVKKEQNQGRDTITFDNKEKEIDITYEM